MTAVEARPHDEWLPEPRHCPSWCEGNHAEALAEGNGWADSQEHVRAGGGDALSELIYAGRPCRAFGGGWDLTARQRPLGPDGGFWGPALIDVDVTEPGPSQRARLALTSGEARTLARQLVAMADLLDLS